MEIRQHQLANGIRLVHQKFNSSPIAHCAFLINAGSRDEEAGKEGIAHFLEHLLFKGTKKRKAIHIIKRMEVVGAELNAYTTKEETCVHASFKTEYFERAIELISDILFNSVYPAKEIKNEKEVVIDEIRSYRDNHFEQIHDDFENLVFKGHPLGNHILGTEDTVNAFKQQDLKNFLGKNYFTDEMVLSIGGNIEFEKAVKIAEKYFARLKAKTSKPIRKKFRKGKARVQNVSKHSSQTHIIAGAVTAGLKSKKRFPLYLLNNILAGPGMNSRLNLSLREKHGLTYHIESNYSAFTDTGLLSIYAGLAPEHYDKARRLMNKEFRSLREKKLSAVQLKEFKQQLIGQLAIAHDSNLTSTIAAAKQILTRGELVSLEETERRINSVESSDILEVANELLDENAMSMLVFEPHD